MKNDPVRVEVRPSIRAFAELMERHVRTFGYKETKDLPTEVKDMGTAIAVLERHKKFTGFVSPKDGDNQATDHADRSVPTLDSIRRMMQTCDYDADIRDCGRITLITIIVKHDSPVKRIG